jgi:hypothetical protein
MDTPLGRTLLLMDQLYRWARAARSVVKVKDGCCAAADWS